MQNSYRIGIVKMVPKRIVAPCPGVAMAAAPGVKALGDDVLEDVEARRPRS
jgi:hypothetical protein